MQFIIIDILCCPINLLLFELHAQILLHRYAYDITKCMFSKGNITEKLRVASFDCVNEIVVDLYAGNFLNNSTDTTKFFM